MGSPLAVVSSQRPASMAELAPLLADFDVHVFVPEHEAADYSSIAGALGVPFTIVSVRTPPGRGFWLSAQRNAVLDWAFGHGHDWAVMVNDDLRPTKRTPTGFTFTKDGQTEKPITVAQAIDAICRVMLDNEARLGGCAPTTNLRFYRKPVQTAHFIMGQLMVVRPTDLRFDLDAGTKEDYDYTLQHLYTYGAVARCDGVLGNFRHFEKKGGWGLQRTTEFDAEMARRLIEKWPNDVKVNTRRGDHEVLMRWSGGRYES